MQNFKNMFDSFEEFLAESIRESFVFDFLHLVNVITVIQFLGFAFVLVMIHLNLK